MKLAMTLEYAGDPRGAADDAIALEDDGLDTIWVPEGYGFDSPTLMGYIAARTRRLEIGSAVLNIFSRTPGTLASTAAGLDNVSRGRALLGLGASGPQVVEGWHGVPYDRPVQRMREVVEVVRAALRREVIEYSGEVLRLPLPPGRGTGLGKPLKMLNRPRRSSVPIYLGALGGRTVEATAEYADGWLPFFYAPEKVEEVWGQALAAGAQRRDPALGPLQISAGGLLAVGSDVKGLLDSLRPQFALYMGGMGVPGSNKYNELVQKYGFAAEAHEVQRLYLDGQKRAAEAAVPLPLLEMCNLVGPEAYVRERIEAFRESGVTTLQIIPRADDIGALVRTVKEWAS